MRADTRPTKDEYYLEIARAVAFRSPCLRRRFGAIIVKEDTIVSTGYNGPARGVINCLEVGCIKEELNLPHYSAYEFCPATHAEENAIINAARHGASVLGGILYLYGVGPDERPAEARPCERCRRVIINAGIERVVIRGEDGSVFKIDVQDWVREDTELYKKRLAEARKGAGQVKG